MIDDVRRRRVDVTDAVAWFEAGADVARGVLGGDLVVVGAGREPGVRVARARRLRDRFAAAGVKPEVVERWTL